MKTPTPKPKAPAASEKDGNPVKFAGTSNQREHLDKDAGCSNGPDLVHRLRHKDLAIYCEKVPDFDREGQ